MSEVAQTPEVPIDPYGEGIRRIIERRLDEGRYVAPETLAECLRLNAGPRASWTTCARISRAR